MAKSIRDQSLTSNRSTYKDLINATSSQASAAGLMRCALQDGRIADLFGLEVAPANPFPSPVKAAELTTLDTSGLTSTGLFAPADRMSLWESRLRERLGTGGSMEFELIWKEVATPAGRSIYRLSRSTPRTSGNGFTGPLAVWPTVTTADGNGGHGMGTASATGKRKDGTKITVSLPGVVKIVFGQTPFGSTETMEKRGALNPAFPCWLMGYPTEWDACAPTATPSSRLSRRK
jgi:hypothetical protein